MIVKTMKGLSFKVQGKSVSEDKTANVVLTHSVKMLLREGSLINMATFKEPVKIVTPEDISFMKPTKSDKINKEK